MHLILSRGVPRLLAVITFTVAVCSEGLVDSVEGITKNLGISEHFIGVAP